MPAGTPVDLVFTRREDDVLADHPLHDGGVTSRRPGVTRDPLTWHTGGLAPGTYEWECWMGPQCHHGTVVVQ